MTLLTGSLDGWCCACSRNDPAMNRASLNRASYRSPDRRTKRHGDESSGLAVSDLCDGVLSGRFVEPCNVGISTSSNLLGFTNSARRYAGRDDDMIS